MPEFPPAVAPGVPLAVSGLRVANKQTDLFDEGLGLAGSNYTNTSGIGTGGSTGSGSTWVYDTTLTVLGHPMGSLASVTTNSVNRQVNMRGIPTDGTGQAFGALTFQISSWAVTNNTTIMNFKDAGGSTQAGIVTTTANKLTLRDITTARYTSTTVLSAGSTYTVEIAIDQPAQKFQMRIWDAQANLLEDSGPQTYTLGAAVKTFNVGWVTSPGAATTMLVPHWGYSTFAWVGPPPGLQSLPPLNWRGKTINLLPGRRARTFPVPAVTVPISQRSSRSTRVLVRRYPAASVPPPPVAAPANVWNPAHQTRPVWHPVWRQRGHRAFPPLPLSTVPVDNWRPQHVPRIWDRFLIRRRGTAAQVVPTVVTVPVNNWAPQHRAAAKARWAPVRRPRGAVHVPAHPVPRPQPVSRRKALWRPRSNRAAPPIQAVVVPPQPRRRHARPTLLRRVWAAIVPPTVIPAAPSLPGTGTVTDTSGGSRATDTTAMVTNATAGGGSSATDARASSGTASDTTTGKGTAS